MQAAGASFIKDGVLDYYRAAPLEQLQPWTLEVTMSADLNVAAETKSTSACAGSWEDPATL